MLEFYRVVNILWEGFVSFNSSCVEVDFVVFLFYYMWSCLADFYNLWWKNTAESFEILLIIERNLLEFFASCWANFLQIKVGPAQETIFQAFVCFLVIVRILVEIVLWFWVVMSIFAIYGMFCCMLTHFYASNYSLLSSTRCLFNFYLILV